MHYVLHACHAAYIILQLILVSLWPSHSFDANDAAVDQMLTNGWHYCLHDLRVVDFSLQSPDWGQFG